MKYSLTKEQKDGYVIYSTNFYLGHRVQIVSLTSIPEFEDYPTVTTNLALRMFKPNTIPLEDHIAWQIFNCSNLDILGDDKPFAYTRIRLDINEDGVKNFTALCDGIMLRQKLDSTIFLNNGEPTEEEIYYVDNDMKELELTNQYKPHQLEKARDLSVVKVLTKRVLNHNKGFLKSPDKETRLQAHRNSKILSQKLTSTNKDLTNIKHFNGEDFLDQRNEDTLKAFQGVKSVSLALE